jgi:putative transposase
LPKNSRITKTVIKRVGQDRYTVSLTVIYTKEYITLKHDKETLTKVKDYLNNHKELCLGLDYAQQGGCVPSSKDKTLLDTILASFQKTYRKNESKLKALQKKLARKIKQSNAYLKLLKRIQRLHRKIANIRKNALHILSFRIAKQFALVSVEDFDLWAMSQTLRLAKNLLDNGFGMFRLMLEYKLKHAGMIFVKIGRFEKSTQTCHECGYINTLTKDMTIKDYYCGGCGRHLYRDYNAALNIRDIGINMIEPNLFKEKEVKNSLAKLRQKRARNLS